MSFRYARSLPTFNAVTAGSTASLNIPLGPTYHRIALNYKRSGTPATIAQMKSDIVGLRLKINGTNYLDADGAYFLDIAEFYGKGPVDGIINIHLAAPWARTPAGEVSLAWGTANVDTITLEVDIDAGAVSPSLVAYADMEQAARPLGAIRRVSSMTFSTATTGVFEISTLPKGIGSLAAIHCRNANITGLGFDVNSVEFINVPLDMLNETYRVSSCERSPVSGYAHLDPTGASGLLDDRWPLINTQDVRLTLTMSASGAVPLFMETIDNPLGPAKV